MDDKKIKHMNQLLLNVIYKTIVLIAVLFCTTTALCISANNILFGVLIAIMVLSAETYFQDKLFCLYLRITHKLLRLNCSWIIPLLQISLMCIAFILLANVIAFSIMIVIALLVAIFI